MYLGWAAHPRQWLVALALTTAIGALVGSVGLLASRGLECRHLVLAPLTAKVLLLVQHRMLRYEGFDLDRYCLTLMVGWVAGSLVDLGVYILLGPPTPAQRSHAG